VRFVAAAIRTSYEMHAYQSLFTAETIAMGGAPVGAGCDYTLSL